MTNTAKKDDTFLNPQLTDLTPKLTDFTLSVYDQDGKQREIDLTFKPFLMRDQEFMERNWSQKEIEIIFKDNKKNELSLIAYRQLTAESKKKICEIEVIDSDDEGNDIVIPNGSQKLMAVMGGIQSLTVLITALLECKGLSLPMLSKIQEAVEGKHVDQA